MNDRMQWHDAVFKAKVALEVIKGEKTLPQLAAQKSLNFREEK
jgi:hypothetical protein